MLSRILPHVVICALVAAVFCLAVGVLPAVTFIAGYFLAAIVSTIETVF